MAQPLETLFSPLLSGVPMTDVRSHIHQWAGRTALNSGSATVTVSTTVVKSDSLIYYGISGNTRANSGVATDGGGIEVTSISEGNFFAFTTHDGSVLPRSVNIMWMIFNSRA